MGEDIFFFNSTDVDSAGKNIFFISKIHQVYLCTVKRNPKLTLNILV
jgi:hypothetical protein